MARVSGAMSFVLSRSRLSRCVRIAALAMVMLTLALVAGQPRVATATANLLPTITSLNNRPAVAGLAAQFDLGLLNDADGNGPWAVVVNWGDRTTPTTFTMRMGGTLPASWHTYTTAGDYLVTITATDAAGGAGVGTFTVHVPANIAPTVTGLNDKPVTAALPAQFDLGLLNDPDGNGPWTVAVDWGDRSRLTTFIMRTGGTLPPRGTPT